MFTNFVHASFDNNSAPNATPTPRSSKYFRKISMAQKHAEQQNLKKAVLQELNRKFRQTTRKSRTSFYREHSNQGKNEKDPISVAEAMEIYLSSNEIVQEFYNVSKTSSEDA